MANSSMWHHIQTARIDMQSCRQDVLQVKLFARDVREHTYFEKLVELLNQVTLIL